ncbi:MAG: hypothetical protein IT388_00605 [Nitrospirales bacterium]|nr:hypothetical protein [Nitrospirales bacterium]
MIDLPAAWVIGAFSLFLGHFFCLGIRSIKKRSRGRESAPPGGMPPAAFPASCIDQRGSHDHERDERAAQQHDIADETEIACLELIVPAGNVPESERTTRG